MSRRSRGQIWRIKPISARLLLMLDSAFGHMISLGLRMTRRCMSDGCSLVHCRRCSACTTAAFPPEIVLDGRRKRKAPQSSRPWGGVRKALPTHLLTAALRPPRLPTQPACMGRGELKMLRLKRHGPSLLGPLAPLSSRGSSVANTTRPHRIASACVQPSCHTYIPSHARHTTPASAWHGRCITIMATGRRPTRATPTKT
mmetsp:Transcript_1614/g.5167  ORF Transcript_1614/g.5167 Transcript_1614/m.5167 type:complete len:200 (+) Transcript_1614:1498-2097(+)